MPQFTYKAKTGPQKLFTGVIDAENLEKAIDKIMALGHSPLEVAPTKVVEKTLFVPTPTRGFLGAPKVSMVVLGAFIHQLGDLLDAQVPMIKALDLMQRQTQHVKFKVVLERVCSFVQGGGSLSEAFKEHPTIFPALQVQMIKCGESSGQLAAILLHLAELIDKDIEIQKRIRMGLTYPMIILGVGFLSIFVLLTFVLPKLTVIFEDFNAALPMPTQIVMALSGFFAEFWWVMLIGFSVAGYYAQRWYASTVGRGWVDAQVVRIPVLKKFIYDAESARFTRALATLLSNGIPVITAMESALVLIGNSVLKEEMKKAALKVRAGTSLSGALKGSLMFSDMALSLVAIAEESGHLDQGLFKLTVMSERNVQQSSETLVTILGPLVLVIVVGIVGFLVISILLPMLQMNMIIN